MTIPNRRIGSVLAMAAVVLLSASASAIVQENAASATTRIVEDGIEVTVHNNRSQPMEVWSVDVVYATATKPKVRDRVTIDALGSIAANSPSSPGGIQAGGSRPLSISARNVASVTSASVAFALFADGSSIGDPNIRAEILKKRLARAHQLEEWILAIREVQSAPIGEKDGRLKGALKAQRDKHAAQPHDSFGQGLDKTIESIVLNAEQNPTQREAMLEQAVAYFERQRVLALKHQK